MSSRQKETSSTSGMRDSVVTSALLQHRAEVGSGNQSPPIFVFSSMHSIVKKDCIQPYATHSFLIFQVIVPSRILQMEEAIKSRNFGSFARLTCADSNQFHAICLDTTPPIFYMNDTSHRYGDWRNLLFISAGVSLFRIYDIPIFFVKFTGLSQRFTMQL